MAEFIFITCQVGAERAVKEEMARQWGEFRFAYSRPGFLTFKLPEAWPRKRGHGTGCSLNEDFDLRSVFARAYAFSLGKVEGSDAAAMAREAWGLFGRRRANRIHVWARDAREAGDHG